MQICIAITLSSTAAETSFLTKSQLVLIIKSIAWLDVSEFRQVGRSLKIQKASEARGRRVLYFRLLTHFIGRDFIWIRRPHTESLNMVSFYDTSPSTASFFFFFPDKFLTHGFNLYGMLSYKLSLQLSSFTIASEKSRRKYSAFFCNS